MNEHHFGCICSECVDVRDGCMCGNCRQKRGIKFGPGAWNQMDSLRDNG